MDSKGLYKKYRIYDAETGEEVTKPSFTLLPVGDVVAREAILAYAGYVRDSNPTLADDLANWIDAIEKKHGKFDWNEYWESKTEENREIPEEWVNE